nr:hypothetical protein Itr_chr15CG11570 [Ipomoea trifida]
MVEPAAAEHDFTGKKNVSYVCRRSWRRLPPCRYGFRDAATSSEGPSLLPKAERHRRCSAVDHLHQHLLP